MTATTLPHTYRYGFGSAVRPGAMPEVEMATSRVAERYPYFFQGQMIRPWMTAQALRVLSLVVGSRFHLPAMMLRKIIALADPVVTSGGGFLRFEGFSACCSTYARVDLTPDAYRGVIAGEGTTNVDFNAPFRAALAQIRDGESMGFAVGVDEVTLLRNEEQHVERKVALPIRWVKSFCEIQAFQSRMRPRYQLRRAEALAFVRSLPASVPARTAFWVVPAGKGLRLSQRESAEGIRITGIERLRLLQSIAPFADTLAIHADDSGCASEWVVHLGPLRLGITISAEVWRGFSGEGQVLDDIASAISPALLDQVRGILRWQSELRVGEFAANWDVPVSEVSRALGVLASRGLAGYDVTQGSHFHRELPFDLDLVELVHPRLTAARKLVASDGVRLLPAPPGETHAEVQGTGVVHQVRLSEAKSSCTCPWHAKHQNTRGPCKHQIAASIAAQPQNEDHDDE